MFPHLPYDQFFSLTVQKNVHRVPGLEIAPRRPFPNVLPFLLARYTYFQVGTEEILGSNGGSRWECHQDLRRRI